MLEKIVLIFTIGFFFTFVNISAQSIFMSTQNYLAFDDGDKRIDWSLDFGYSFDIMDMKNLIYTGIDMDSEENAGMGYSLGYSAFFAGGPKGFGIDFFVEARTTRLREWTFPFFEPDKSWMFGYGVGTNLYIPIVRDKAFIKVGGRYERLSRKKDSISLKWESVQPGIGIIVWLNGESVKTDQKSSN